MRAKSRLFIKTIMLSAVAVTSALLLSSCNGGDLAEVDVIESLTPPLSSTDVATQPTSTPNLEEVISGRTPVPTSSAGRLEQNVQDLVADSELAKITFLGLEIASWISLLFAALIIYAAYLIGTLVVNRGQKIFIRQVSEDLEQKLLKKIFSDLRWFLVVLIASNSLKRLGFFPDGFRTLLGDLYFILEIIIAYRIASNSISLAEDWYRQRSVKDGREKELTPVITFLVRTLRAIIILIFITIILAHYGVNVTPFAAALGVGGLAISLAARDTIADAISGFILLVDRPFRVGDRIEIQGVNTWGDVVNIGLRTTQIRTRDNRTVLVPNSILSSSQVINYSYPDPRYRIETHVGIAYGTNIEQVRKLIIETVRELDFVLSDKPVDAFYSEMGDSAMIFLVRWWIESYADFRHTTDRVHTTLQAALDDAGIESPFPTQNIKMQVESNMAEDLSQGLKDTQK